MHRLTVFKTQIRRFFKQNAALNVRKKDKSLEFAKGTGYFS